MKLNFWQWLGLGLLILGLAWVGYNKLTKKKSGDQPQPSKPAAATTRS